MRVCYENNTFHTGHHHLRIGPYKGSVNSVQNQMPFHAIVQCWTLLPPFGRLISSWYYIIIPSQCSIAASEFVALIARTLCCCVLCYHRQGIACSFSQAYPRHYVCLDGRVNPVIFLSLYTCTSYPKPRYLSCSATIIQHPSTLAETLSNEIWTFLDYHYQHRAISGCWYLKQYW